MWILSGSKLAVMNDFCSTLGRLEEQWHPHETQLQARNPISGLRNGKKVCCSKDSEDLNPSGIGQS